MLLEFFSFCNNGNFKEFKMLSKQNVSVFFETTGKEMREKLSLRTFSTVRNFVMEVIF